MDTRHLTRLLTGVALVLAIPGIACFGWYSVESAGITDRYVQAAVVAAYPTALISGVILAQAFFSAKRSRAHIWITALTFAFALWAIFVVRV